MQKAEVPYTTALFSADLYVSRTTIRKDLQQITEWLSNYHLTIQQKAGKGIELIGAEFDKRNLMVYMNQLNLGKESLELDMVKDYRMSLETYYP